MNAVPLFRIIVIKSTLWFHFMGTLNTKAKSCAFSLVSGFTRGSNSQCYITFFISSFELNDRVSNLCGKMSSCEIIPVAINHHLECVLKRRDFSIHQGPIRALTGSSTWEQRGSGSSRSDSGETNMIAWRMLGMFVFQGPRISSPQHDSCVSDFINSSAHRTLW